MRLCTGSAQQFVSNNVRNQVADWLMEPLFRLISVRAVGGGGG